MTPSPKNEEQSYRSRSELSSLSLKDLFFKYLRYLPLIILCVLLAMGGALIYLRYATQIYSSSGLLIIQNDRSQSSNSDDKVEDLLLGGGKTQNIQNEMEILRSRPLMLRVVNALNLGFSVEQQGSIKNLNAYKQAPFSFTSSISDSAHGFMLVITYLDQNEFTVNGKPAKYGVPFQTGNGEILFKQQAPAIPGTLFHLRWSSPLAVAAGFTNGVTVLPRSANSGILTVSLRASNPYLAADVVNSLMSEYAKMNIEQNNFSTDQMLSFIDNRLAILNKELDTSQQRLLIFQQKNDLVDIDAQSAAFFSSLSDAEKSILEQQTRLSVAELIDGYLKDSRNQFERVVVPSSLGLEDPVLNELVGAYNTAQLERKGLLESNMPPANPAVRQAESQIEVLRQSIVENVGNVRRSFSTTLSTLQRRSGEDKANIKALPYKIKEYVELKRQADIKLELVKLLEAKREETAIARSSTVSSSRVIQDAEPAGPISPNPSMIRIIALAVGLVAPLLFIFVRELLNDKVGGRNDIERITSAPIVGEVGHSFSDEVLVVTTNSRTMVSEQFRIIRSNLQYIIGKIDKPVIMVTSSFSGEGKSFVSTNIGAAMAVTGKKTIILEFDIRKPKVLSGLRMTRTSGISNYLVGKEKLDKLYVPVPGVDNLFVLPCGPVPPNPAEILLDPAVDEMFAYLKDHFDVIIIDTAPVGMVSDAITLGKYADCTLYLVRQGHTFKKQIGLIDDLYTQKKLPAISIVVNDVKLNSGYGYYGYGQYSYGYGYGNDYYQEEKPLSFWQKIGRSLRLNTILKPKKNR